MTQLMSLEQLDNFLTEAKGKVDGVAQELHEVQVQFVSAHKVNKTMHDATLNDLSMRAAHDLTVLPADIRAAIEGRVADERETLDNRRQELLSHIVPQAEKIADDLLARAQKAMANIQQQNPRLNAR